jgi:hypothetical protein
MKKLAIGIGLVVAITGGLWWSRAPSKSVDEADTAASATRKDRPNVALLERLAQEACSCEVDGGPNCAAAYNEAIAGYQVQSMATACAPISTESDLISTAGKEYFVTTGFNVVGKLPPGMSNRLCRRADAQAVEAAYYEALGPIPKGSEPADEEAMKLRYAAADRAIILAIEDIRRGKKMTPISNGGSCV